MKRRLATVIGLVVAAFMVAVIAQSNAAGEWNITATGAQGTTTSTMTLEQDGETLTGTLNLAEGGSMPLKGMMCEQGCGVPRAFFWRATSLPVGQSMQMLCSATR